MVIGSAPGCLQQGGAGATTWLSDAGVPLVEHTMHGVWLARRLLDSGLCVGPVAVTTYRWETEAQRGEGACTRCHSEFPGAAGACTQVCCSRSAVPREGLWSPRQELPVPPVWFLPQARP